MPLDTAVTERAARILIERDPGPGDRLDAFLVLAGQEYLWRRRDRPRRRLRRGGPHVRGRGRPAPPAAHVTPLLRPW